jgi:selenocysteine-specific translation elongation factor
MHLTIGIFGTVEAANEIAKKIAKAGTKNDIAVYNHASSEGVFTYVCPNSDRIQSLVQSLAMAEIPVLVASEITKEVGESIIAIDAMGFEKGFIIASDSTRDQLMNFIKGTSLEKFSFVDESNLRLEIMKINFQRSPGEILIPIDNYFNVKSVGTVILGIIKSGSLKKYDKLMVEPLGKEILIKGLQSQDKDLETAEAGMRIGLSLKGVEADELKRGFIICSSMKKSSEFTLKLKRNKFSKQELKQGMQLSLCIGLQYITSIVESADGDIIKLKSLSPLAYTGKEKIIMASQTEALPRVIGSCEMA